MDNHTVEHYTTGVSIVLTVMTRPRVIDGPLFLCNSAYLGECCFFRVIGTGKWVSIRIED